jgi:uncharacterized protein
MISNETLSRRLKRTAGRLLLSFGTLGYSYFVAPFRFELTHTDVPIARLPAAFDGLKVVAFGDVHYNWRIVAKHIAQVVAMANNANPDAIFLLGDYVSKQGKLAFPTGLADLQARLGVYAILGNHDFLGRDRIVTRQLERSGATVLRNRNLALEQGGQRIWVAGVDDLRSRTANLGQALAGIPGTEVSILLAHNPDFAARAARIEPCIDLMLAAHTHGGQVKLPILGPPALPHNHKEWLAGLYRVNGMWLYINRGIGMSSIAHRLNVRPEVSVITLRKA